METATRQDEFITPQSGAITEEKIQLMIDDPTSWGAGSSDAHVREAVKKAALYLARFAVQQISSKSIAPAAQTRPARVSSVILPKCKDCKELAGVQELTDLLTAVV